MGKLNAQPVAACVPAQHKVASLVPVPDCKETWVDGRAGTGELREEGRLPGPRERQAAATCLEILHCLKPSGGFFPSLQAYLGAHAQSYVAMSLCTATGMEGPDCDVPINECVRGTASCSPRATCIDTKAGYECRCFW